MPLLTALACLTMAAQGKPSAPPPDRSGKPALLELIDGCRKLDRVHLVILKSARESDRQPFYPDTRIDLWLASPRFRLESSNMWEAGTVLVSDGSSALSDSNSDSSSVVVTHAKGSLLGTAEALKFTLDDYGPFFALLKDPAKLDEWVDKAQPIVCRRNRDGTRTLSFSGTRMGSVTIECFSTRAGWMPRSIDYDNLPILVELHQNNPEWADEPAKGAMTRCEILIADGRPDRRLFEVRPAKGRIVDDQRRTKAVHPPCHN